MTVSATAADPRPLRLAVYGAGRWGQVLMRNIVAFPDLELAAVISSKTDLSDAMTLGAPVFDDWRIANSRMKLDGIVLALPPDRQPEIAEEIIKSGLPLFLEKPLALNNDAALSLVKVADASGFVGLVDHLHLLTPEFQELTRQVRHRGTVGAIKAISGNRGPARGSWPVLWDWAPHDVAMALTLIEAAPVSVSAAIVERSSDGIQELENVRLTLTFADGAVADIITGNAFDERLREFVVFIDDTTLSYVETPDNERSLVVGSGDEAQTVCVDSIPPLTAALGEFADRIRQGRSGKEDLGLGSAVVRVLWAAEESMRQGIEISIEAVDYRATRGAMEC